MLKKLRRWFTLFLTLNKSEQRGILLLIILICAIGLINLLLPHMTGNHEQTETDAFKNEIEQFVAAQQIAEDSIRIEKLQNRGELTEELALQKLTPFPFNPNNLPEEAWAKLGLTQKQIKTIKNYEAKGGKFKNKEDLKKMYSISDAEYMILESYINIPPEFKTRVSQSEKKPSVKSVRYLSTEINAADSATLVHSLHLSPWIARRIIKYRNLLGGFSTPEQLKEVYGFDSLLYRKTRRYIMIDTSLIVKLDINKAGFKEILRHPYISYDITKKIVNYRAKNGPFTSTEQLTGADILSESLYIKLEPYLSVDAH